MNIQRRIARIMIYYNLSGKFIAMCNLIILVYLFITTNELGFWINLAIVSGGGLIILALALLYYKFILSYEYDEMNKLDKVKMKTLQNTEK